MYMYFQLPNTAVSSIENLAKNLTLKSMAVSFANKYRKTVMLYHIMKYKPCVHIPVQELSSFVANCTQT